MSAPIPAAHVHALTTPITMRAIAHGSSPDDVTEKYHNYLCCNALLCVLTMVMPSGVLCMTINDITVVNIVASCPYKCCVYSRWLLGRWLAKFTNKYMELVGNGQFFENPKYKYIKMKKADV